MKFRRKVGNVSQISKDATSSPTKNSEHGTAKLSSQLTRKTMLNKSRLLDDVNFFDFSETAVSCLLIFVCTALLKGHERLPLFTK